MLAMHDVLDAIAEPVRRWCGPIALQDSADAVQETLVIVLRRLGELREPAALFAWVRTIAVREAIRVAGRAAQAVPYELDDIPAPGDPALTAEVHDVLARLSPEHRAVLMLRDMDGFDEPTAAAVLSVPEGTVRSRLFRARQAFRRLWQADGGAPSDYWPVGEFDELQRLRVLHAAMPGTMLAETVLRAPLDSVVGAGRRGDRISGAGPGRTLRPGRRPRRRTAPSRCARPIRSPRTV